MSVSSGPKCETRLPSKEVALGELPEDLTTHRHKYTIFSWSRGIHLLQISLQRYGRKVHYRYKYGKLFPRCDTICWPSSPWWHLSSTEYWSLALPGKLNLLSRDEWKSHPRNGASTEFIERYSETWYRWSLLMSTCQSKTVVQAGQTRSTPGCGITLTAAQRSKYEMPSQRN
jgi:hypothetical protein